MFFDSNFDQSILNQRDVRTCFVLKRRQRVENYLGLHEKKTFIMLMASQLKGNLRARVSVFENSFISDKSSHYYRVYY